MVAGAFERRVPTRIRARAVRMKAVTRVLCGCPHPRVLDVTRSIVLPRQTSMWTVTLSWAPICGSASYVGQKGWGKHRTRFKCEGEQFNIGFGTGKKVLMVNSNIARFHVVSP